MSSKYPSIDNHTIGQILYLSASVYSVFCFGNPEYGITNYTPNMLIPLTKANLEELITSTVMYHLSNNPDGGTSFELDEIDIAKLKAMLDSGREFYLELW